MSVVIAGLPWLLFVAFWIFVIWAVLALIGVLREIVSELRNVTESVRMLGGREASRSSGA